ncbi:ABC transporter permease [Desulfobotulus sp. H1]|uniref:ABC transporter permease n=1 Tax=Desulfobotulus pelophilus TaxID=2823377 RepID=A0ABT3N8S8_9BACT|nr:ABC transporter permease [Desulfobotulus pelophilus]MCW7753437.1 ABC transporter permease [Desulfobotulus pelophilus]
MRAVTRRRMKTFASNRRAWISLWMFMTLFTASIFSEFIANERPLVLYFQDRMYFPVFSEIPETLLGGYFETDADFTDPAVIAMAEAHGWMLWPPVRFSWHTVNLAREGVYPAAPGEGNWLGTDDHGRDILARLLYGFRVSVLFGLCLAVFSTLVGIVAGAVQGYFGGKVDLFGQRFMEIWSGLPMIYLLIILSSFMQPGFFVLLFIMLLFSWMGMVDVVRAEVLRCRNLGYVKAARCMGLPDRVVLFRHVLPNAMVATLTFLPFVLNGAITTLTSLDFLGFGLPPGSPSLGELLAQGKENLDAPWIGIAAFAVLASMLSLLVFIGEGVRDAFDPRHEG